MYSMTKSLFTLASYFIICFIQLSWYQMESIDITFESLFLKIPSQLLIVEVIVLNHGNNMINLYYLYLNDYPNENLVTPLCLLFY